MITPPKVFRIIIVEDNPADVYLLQQALKQAGLNFELTVIEDGAKALEFIQTKAAEIPKHDLAVLDLNLPSHGGVEVLAALRQNPDLADVPVAVVTSSAAAVERGQVEKLRVERFITKPPDLDEFLKIGEILKEVLLGDEPRPKKIL